MIMLCNTYTSVGKENTWAEATHCECCQGLPVCDTVHGELTMEENWVKARRCIIKQHFAIEYTHGCTLLQRQCSMRIKL